VSRLTHTLHQIAEKMPLGLLRTLVNRDFIVINYHMVSNEKLPHVENLYEYKTPEMFERDLHYLRQNFRLVSYTQLVDHFRNGTSLPKKAVALTFDDGFAECFSVVRPLLSKYGFPCMFFVNTKYIDNLAIANAQKVSLLIDRIKNESKDSLIKIVDLLSNYVGYLVDGKDQMITLLKTSGVHDPILVERLSGSLQLDFDQFLKKQTPYLSTDQIRTMSSEGFTIGSHAVEHIKFSSLTDAEVEQSMANSCAIIGELTGNSSVPFAFPHNSDGVSRELLADILERHPRIGLLFDANGIHSEKNFLFSRLSGDHVRSGEQKNSGLPISMKKAYIEEISYQLHGQQL